MTLIRGKSRSWMVLAIVLAGLVGAVAGAEDGLSGIPGPTRVAVSADLGRLVLQAAPEREPGQPGSSDAGELRLSLREAVVLALKNNLDIAISTYNPKITAESIIIAKAVFDPVASLKADADRTVTPTSSALAQGIGTTLITKNVDLNASLTQTLPFGASYTLGLINNRFDTTSAFAQPPNGINPSYTTVFTVSLTQNLSRTSGPM